jgi:hypothetical protein
VPGRQEKRNRTGKGRTGRQEEEEEKVFGTNKTTVRSPEVEKNAGREMEKMKDEKMKVEIKEKIKKRKEEKITKKSREQ